MAKDLKIDPDLAKAKGDLAEAHNSASLIVDNAQKVPNAGGAPTHEREPMSEQLMSLYRPSLGIFGSLSS